MNEEAISNEQKYDLAGQVIDLAMKVHSAFGSGFLESVCHQTQMSRQSFLSKFCLFCSFHSVKKITFEFRMLYESDVCFATSHSCRGILI